MSEIESISIKQCPICGKEFSVLYPDMYRYKRNTRNQLKYFCSWSCLREFDKQKGEKIMTVLSDDQRAEAVRIALTGKSPMPFLKECGIKNPSQCFKIIKKNLKESDPETWAKIPGTFKNYNYKPKPRKVKQIETPEGEFVPAGKPKPLDGGEWEKLETPEAVPTVKVDGPIRIQTPKTIFDIPAKQIFQIPEPPKPIMEYRVTGISTSAGDFQYYSRNGYLDWTPIDHDTVSLNLEEWKEFMKIFPEALQRLGVEL